MDKKRLIYLLELTTLIDDKTNTSTVSKAIALLFGSLFSNKSVFFHFSLDNLT
jgi:hypothetical protein